MFQEKTLRGQRRNGLSKNTLLDNRFSARPLRRSFGAPPEVSERGCQRGVAREGLGRGWKGLGLPYSRKLVGTKKPSSYTRL